MRIAQGYWERRTMEAIEIWRSRRSMNLDKGLLLPSLWNPILDLRNLISTPPPIHPICTFLPVVVYTIPMYIKKCILELTLDTVSELRCTESHQGLT